MDWSLTKEIHGIERLSEVESWLGVTVNSDRLRDRRDESDYEWRKKGPMANATHKRKRTDWLQRLVKREWLWMEEGRTNGRCDSRKRGLNGCSDWRDESENECRKDWRSTRLVKDRKLTSYGLMGLANAKERELTEVRLNLTQI